MLFAGPGPHATEGRGLLRAAGPLPANFAPLVQSALASLWMVATPPPVGCQNPRDVPGGPRPAKSWRRQASCIKRPRQHGLRLQAAPFEPADHPHGFFGTPGVKRGAGVHRRRRMLTPMPAHEKVKLMGIPASMRWTDALPVQDRGQIGIPGDTRRAELIEQEAKLGRGRCLTAIACAHAKFGSRGVISIYQDMGTTERNCEGTLRRAQPLPYRSGIWWPQSCQWRQTRLESFSRCAPEAHFFASPRPTRLRATGARGRSSFLSCAAAAPIFVLQ